MSVQPPTSSFEAAPASGAAVTGEDPSGAAPTLETTAGSRSQNDPGTDRRTTLDAEQLSREQARNGQIVRGSDDDSPG
jgi:hypothetical protein